MTARHWTKQVSADFNTASDWSGGAVPGSTDDAILDAAGASNYTVSTSTGESVNSIQLASTATLSLGGAATFTAKNGTGSGANAGTILVNNNNALQLGGTVKNSGLIQLASSANNTDLAFVQNTTFSGTGKITLSDNGNNRIYVATAGSVFENFDNTISGAGQFGLGDGNLVFKNDAAGIVNATGGNALVLDTANAVSNAGLLESTGPGGLRIQSTTVNGTGGGDIRANNGSHVDLQSATLVGGTLTTVGIGVIDTTDRGSVLDGVTNAGRFQVNNNTAITIQNTITNSGTISLASIGNSTDISVSSLNATLAGGLVNMSDSSQNYITGTLSGARGAQFVSTLTNTGIIRGAGVIGGYSEDGSLALVNTGTGRVEASGTNALVIDTGNANAAGSNVVNNAGVLESLNTTKATAEGGLNLRGVVVANSAGYVGASGLHTHVDLQSAIIRGGHIFGQGGGVVQTVDRGSVLDGTTNAIIITFNALAILNNTSLTIEGLINATGGIALQSGGNSTQLVVASAGANLNAGNVTLSDNSQNYVIGTVSGPVHHQVVSNFATAATISGAGTIGSSLKITNTGAIDATGKNNALIVVAGSALAAGSNVLVNDGILESTNTNKQTAEGGLVLNGLTVDNTKGKISAAGLFTHVDLQSATINGGLVTTSNTGVIDTVDRGSVLNGASTLTNSGQININNNTSLTIRGAIKNTASIDLDSGGNFTALVIGAADATLSGAGKVSLTANGANFIYSSTGTTKLINVDNAIVGGGQIGGISSGGGSLNLVNQAAGVVQAFGTTSLVIDTGAGVVTNSGKVEAGSEVGAGGGTLIIRSTTIDGSSGGLLIANDASTVEFQSALIIGGTLQVAGAGLFETVDTGTTLDGTTSTVNNQGVVNILNNTALTLQGAINNTNTLALDSGGNNTDLIIDVSNATLNGGGSVTMTANGANRIYGATTASTLTNVDNTIIGGGQMGAGQLTLVNQAAGIIEASGAATLLLNTGAGVVTNNGLLEAGDSITPTTGTLLIQNTTVDSSGGGTITANDGSSVQFQNAFMIGGTLTLGGAGSGSFQTNDTLTVFDGQTSTVNNAAIVNISNNTALTLQGKINNTNSINLQSGGNNTDLIIDVTNVTLSGAGTIALSNNGANRIYGATAGSVLTNVDNTIIGGGQLGSGQLTLVNQTAGVIDGDVSTALTINTGAATIINAGHIQADTGGVVVIDSLVNNTGVIEANGGDMVVNATITGAGSAIITGGTLEFTQSNVSQKVSFTGANGTLQLDHSNTYTGVVSGFTTTTGTAFDLRDISDTATAKYAGTASSGTLTVTDGTTTAVIHMVGNYLGSTFTVSNDGSGHAFVQDPPGSGGVSHVPSHSAQTHGAVHAFVEAMASLSGASAGAVHLSPAQRFASPVLVSPRFMAA